VNYCIWYHLGSVDDHTNYKAEVVGLLMAMWMLWNQHVVGRLDVLIYVNNQALIWSITGGGMCSSLYLVSKILQQAKEVNSALAQHKLKVRWISGHSKVGGNEKADEEAKAAAQGNSSMEHWLPPLLRHCLPASIATAKQCYLKTLQDMWKEWWHASPHYARLSRFDNELPMTKFQKIREGLSWAQASVLAQIRMGHVPLNFYLFQINKAETDKCASCEQVTGQASRESIRHFLNWKDYWVGVPGIWDSFSVTFKQLRCY
jgi:ribonuclease HI